MTEVCAPESRKPMAEQLLAIARELDDLAKTRRQHDFNPSELVARCVDAWSAIKQLHASPNGQTG